MVAFNARPTNRMYMYLLIVLLGTFSCVDSDYMLCLVYVGGATGMVGSFK